jgi:hypothetical protein
MRSDKNKGAFKHRVVRPQQGDDHRAIDHNLLRSRHDLPSRDAPRVSVMGGANRDKVEAAWFNGCHQPADIIGL